MISVKNKIGFWFGVAIFCFLFSSAIFAANDPKTVALMGENNLINPASPNHQSINPLRETGKLDIPCRWGNDILVAGGSMAGGFSADYDDSGYIYAARCTTYVDSSNAAIRIYKSTNGGASWFVLTGFAAIGGAFKFSYPVVLTGSNPSKLYVFAMTSTQNGDIGMARFTQNGVWEGWYNVKADVDTITYYSACTNLGLGGFLMAAYQKEANGHKIYTTISIDSGATWGYQSYVTSDGAHPDIAYGSLGYVYLVWESTSGGDVEIHFAKNTSYCDPNPIYWQDFQSLTANTSDDVYPKVAALHTLPKDTACVWVIYNHYAPPTGKVTNVDLNFAYSTNSGTSWTKDQVIANDPLANEMAADIRVYRSSTIYVDMCYLKESLAFATGLDIFYTWSQAPTPNTFASLDTINDYSANWSNDSREVCQIVPIPDSLYPGIMYAGIVLKKNGDLNPLDGGWNLYFDQHEWMDVGDDAADMEFPTQFSLSANYPNPFNPETKIDYSTIKVCRVKLEIFNVLGQKIRTLVDEDQSVGNKSINWDGRNENGEQVTSGVYFYRLQAGDYSQTKKMVLIR